VLATILQVFEKSFGPHLVLAAEILFWLGAAMAAYVVLAPLLRVVIEVKAARLGMERAWIMQCPTCRRMTVASNGSCEQCGKSLDIPLVVRVRNFFGDEGESRWLRTLRWSLSVAGASLFAAVTVFALMRSGGWHPQTTLERLFVGFALISWTGIAWLFGRAVGIGTGGPLSRLRDAVLALAGIAILSAAITFAGAARPQSEEVLVRIVVRGTQAQVDDRTIPLADSQLGFEYLQVDHELVGFRHVIPLAVVGAQRIDLPLSELEDALATHLWTHAQRYTARGLTVRKRTEQLRASEPGTIDILLRGGEIAVRQPEPPAPPPAGVAN
jgi:hypothetical protein